VEWVKKRGGLGDCRTEKFERLGWLLFLPTYISGPTPSNHHTQRSTMYDEGITYSDTTILVTYDTKVKHFFVSNCCIWCIWGIDVVAPWCSIVIFRNTYVDKKSVIHTWKVCTKYQRSWSGTKWVPPHHHITFGPKMKRDQIQHVLELDSDCMTWAQRSIAPHTWQKELSLMIVVTCPSKSHTIYMVQWSKRREPTSHYYRKHL
jgi:hypothetical protein